MRGPSVQEPATLRARPIPPAPPQQRQWRRRDQRRDIAAQRDDLSEPAEETEAAMDTQVADGDREQRNSRRAARDSNGCERSKVTRSQKPGDPQCEEDRKEQQIVAGAETLHDESEREQQKP